MAGMVKCFVNGAIIGPIEIVRSGTVVCRDGMIAGVGDAVPTNAEIVDAKGGLIVPGYVDMHFYGPYFAENKVGCHSKDGRRDPDAEEYLHAFETGIVKIATCAAELPGMETFFHEAAKRGILGTCGHSNASWGEMARAYAAGMR